MENMYCEFEWNGILISLDYQYKRWSVIDHIELKSIDPPNAPLPITETGYRSHYLHTEEMEPYNFDPKQYITAFLDYAARDPAWKKQQDAARQYSLF